MIADFLGWVQAFFGNLLAVSLDYLGELLGWIFDGLIQLLKALFYPVLVVVALILYFFYKLAELVVKIFSVLLALGKLLYAFVQGIIATIAGFVWTPTTPTHGSWSFAFFQAFETMEDYYQLDKIAYVLLFAIWIITAFAAIRIITGGRGGGGE